MASAWLSSFGTAWASSWGATAAPPTPTPDPVATSTPRSGALPGIVSLDIQARGRLLKDDNDFLELFLEVADSGLFDRMRDED